MIHNLRDFSAFSESTAHSVVKDFNQAILDAVAVKDVSTALVSMSATPNVTDLAR